jgi:hypothetical protein
LPRNCAGVRGALFNQPVACSIEGISPSFLDLAALDIGCDMVMLPTRTAVPSQYAKRPSFTGSFKVVRAGCGILMWASTPGDCTKVSPGHTFCSWRPGESRDQIPANQSWRGRPS